MPIPCLILGATGRVGRLVQAAARRDTGDLALTWQTRHAPAGVHWLHWDLTTEAAALAGALPPGGVVVSLLGGTPGTGGDLSDTAPLARAAIAAGRVLGAAHVFLASSAAVYGRPEGDAPLSETTEPRPVSGYGRAKRAMEQAVAEGQGVTCLRIGNVAGADQLLLNAATATAQAPLILDRFADGTGPDRSYIGPETFLGVVGGLARAAVAGHRLPPVLNLAAPRPVAMADLLAASGTPYRFRPAPEGALPRVVLDTGALEALVDFRAEDSAAGEIVRQWLACRERAA